MRSGAGPTPQRCSGIDSTKSSPAFVREPEGNGCIERFFRTLKEQLLWSRPFQSIPELVRELKEFRALYNQQWLIERLCFEPPVVVAFLTLSPKNSSLRK